ncbi:FAD-dependent oxidoreductase [Holophaga foetida]|uniref:FAD-dependent oxidoreductase n=1 Tax=Holophaga foetida TaxID=35839 RepID=UPI000247469C|nr:FAD-binding protein [Holophaga foetida]
MKIIDTDIAIMGSGLAGLSAAVTALGKGAKVAVFEKRPFQGGGVSNTPMMTLAVRDDQAYKDKAFKIHMDYTNWNANPDVVRSWIDNSSAIPGFIKGLGIEFMGEKMTPFEELGERRGYGAGFPNAFNIGDYYFLKPIGRGHGAAVICKKMADRVRALGGELHFSTPIQSLIKEGDKVIGALAKDKDGNTVQINAKAVIVASGGFSDDKELLAELGLKLTDKNCSDGGNVVFNHFCNSQLTGDGQKAIWKIGGARSGMAVNGHNMCPGPGIVGDNVAWLQQNKLRTIQEQPYLWVNQAGHRFISEEQSDCHMAMVTAINNQKEKFAYIIFDEATVRHMETEGVEFYYFIFEAAQIPNIRPQFETVIAKGNKHVFMTDTLEEMAEKTGICKEGLLKTVETYNGYCDKGTDPQYAKNPKYLRPVREGKFYALRVFVGGYHAYGGIKINGKCEVIDKDFNVIKGLYAGGDCCAGEIYGNPPVGGIGVSTLSFSQGFITGDQAAAYVQQ